MKRNLALSLILIAATAAAQLNFKSAPDRWSVAARSDRHTKQILEVKADPNFPKS